jgi:predicted kinase
VEAIILIGIPGSGKSSFYKERFYATHLRINRDMIKTRRRERALIETCFKIQQRFVLDNVNATRADRSELITAGHAARFRVIGYFFQVSTRVAVARNKERSGKAQIPLVESSVLTNGSNHLRAGKDSTNYLLSRLARIGISSSTLLLRERLIKRRRVRGKSSADFAD